MRILAHEFKAFRGMLWRSPERRAGSSVWPLMLTGAWVIAVFLGFLQFARYERQPGEQVRAPREWPGESLQLQLAGPTLVFAAHPKCPCTRAGLAELQRIMDRVGDRLQAYVVFLNLEGAEDSIEDSIQDAAQRIAGVKILRDDGQAMRRFGALTSGQTYLYDEQGKLVFQGGITPARGQMGDNAGTRAILSYLTERTRDVELTPAYGCPLFSAQAP